MKGQASRRLEQLKTSIKEANIDCVAQGLRRCSSLHCWLIAHKQLVFCKHVLISHFTSDGISLHFASVSFVVAMVKIGEKRMNVTFQRL